jgi:hypothetical protein
VAVNHYEWLASLKANSWSLSYNDDHAANYTTAKEWIEDRVPEWFEHTDPEELQRMKDTNTIWSLQVYPDTPIGSYTWYGATMDYVVGKAREFFERA